MTLQNMRYILEIANCGSFSEASKSLYMSQSALSAAVKETEQELGTAIFHRTNRGVSLTYDGEDFVKYAREIVEQSDYLVSRYQNRNYLPMRFSVTAQHLPFAVRAFNSLLNRLNLSTFDIAMRESSTQAVLHDVSTGKSELGVVTFHDSHFHLIEKSLHLQELTFTELGRLNIYVFMRKSHPLANRSALSLEELRDYAFVTYDQESSPNQYTEEILFYEYLDKNIHVSDRCTKVALVRGSNCFSIGPDLPNSNADSFHKGLGEVVAIPIKEPLEPLHAGYLSKKGVELSSIARSYIELLTENIRLLSKS